MKIGEIHEISLEEIGAAFEYLDDDLSSEYESVLYVKDSEAIPIEVYVRSVYFGKVKAIQWTFRDISARKELDDVRNDLIAMIYHDLRSPLANVISSLDLLNGLLKEKDEMTESLFDIANNSTERMQRLISSLLDINRLEAGQKIILQQNVSLDTLFQDAVDAVSPAVTARHQQLEAKSPNNLPGFWGDEDMIRRVLINLLENASKFTPLEGKIEIGAKADDKWLQIWIIDNGRGIPSEDRIRIFEKFARGKGGEKISGLGIGLAFCRLAIEGHGGKIWVDKHHKTGTRFNVTLPLSKNQKQDV